MRELVGGVVAAVLVLLGMFALVALVAFGSMLWTVVIQPEWEARDIRRAADKASALPFVKEAHVEVDWFDGNYFAVELTADATDADAQQLWCDALLDVADEVAVYQGNRYLTFAPERADCADPELAAQARELNAVAETSEILPYVNAFLVTYVGPDAFVHAKFAPGVTAEELRQYWCEVLVDVDALRADNVSLKINRSARAMWNAPDREDCVDAYAVTNE